MKFRISLLVAVVLAAPVLADSTGAGICYTVSDPDVRAFCRAKEHHDSSICYSIQKQDLRAECMAETQ